MALRDGCSINASPSDDCEETTPLLGKRAERHPVPPQCCSSRYNLAFMMFCGFAVVYGLRVNLSVAMVSMVNQTASQPVANGTATHACPVPAPGFDNSSRTPDQHEGVPQYSWDSETQGLLLGAFFFGYLLTQIPGGYLSGHHGGKVFLGGGVLGTALLTLLTPLAARLGPYWLFALRALEGFGEGVTFPAMMAMWTRWAPPLERSRLMTLSGSGANFGAFVALPLTGYISDALGWPAVFYCCGSAGVLWSLFWFLLVSDEPLSHPRISQEEKAYITQTIGPQGSGHGWSVPLKPMVCSVPLWAIVVTQMCGNWSYYTMLTSLPTYMDSVLHFDLKENAFLSALPYLGAWLCAMIAGVVADTLLERELLSVTAVRKTFTFLGFVLPAASLVAVGYSGCSGVLAVTFLTLSTTVGGLSAAGVYMNQIDIAPRYAGILQGITNTFATVPGVIAPIATGYFTQDHSLEGWRNVFFVGAGIGAAGALVFTLFGSGKLQRWALTEEEWEEAKVKENGAVSSRPTLG